ncbi:hypothetical protein HFO55_07785 [Rhizobium leguminosarum]|uniref:hypothetical protein n=1 Tax=Rhizobium leguminosarum TaxID=384 RepID=UPI001C93E5A3|nr:hypothetical protein [Rhizobium leguminosarum]MBY5371813.1 hypothetical protein [Rhizobium leguminosarum]MBY5567151.1 hypothetical protein [Rhizobium leguminosarum]MBY5574429.1 hypothetical protein [Rhizobium leguminosarum]
MPPEDTKIKKSNWALIGAAITVLYVGACGLLAYQNESSLLQQVEDLGLNELGDALAGGFAPLAFLWLFIATMIQGQELHDSRRVMTEQADAAEKQALAATKQVDHMGEQVKALAEQNRIAAEVAAANYQVALYEKRVELYTELDAAGFSAVQSGDLAPEVRTKILRAVNKGRWIVGPKTREWLLEIRSATINIGRLQVKRSIREDKLKHAAATGKETEVIQRELDELLDEQNVIFEELDKLLEAETLNEVLGPYLQLPGKIGAVDIKDV